jgi:hypothetical protein
MDLHWTGARKLRGKCVHLWSRAWPSGTTMCETIAHGIAVHSRPKRGQAAVQSRLSVRVGVAAESRDLLLCKRKRLCYTLPAREYLCRSFLGSSAVEHPTVNRMVAGSNPARGATSIQALSRSSGSAPRGAFFIGATLGATWHEIHRHKSRSGMGRRI